MVNKSLLYKVDDLNKSLNTIMKPWGQRKRYDLDGRLTTQLRRMKSKIRKLLFNISGENIVEMLKG
jgi:flagellar biosynthesis/type III secretory pathway chaperone